MTRPIRQEVLTSARTMEDVYTQMCVLPGANGQCPGSPPPTTPRPEGAAASMTYLTGADGRSFNLGILYDNNSAALNYLTSQLGYVEADGRRVYDAWIATPANQRDSYVGGLSVADRRQFEIFKTMQLLNYFRTTYNSSDFSVGGNRDNNPDILTADEIQRWADERITASDPSLNEDDHTTRYFELGRGAVSRMHALLGLAAFLQTEPPAPPRTADVRAGVTLNPTDTITLTAPNGDWRPGDQIFIDTVAWTGGIVPQSGQNNVQIPCSSLTVGAHRIEVRNGTSIPVTLPVTIQAADVTPVVASTGPRWYEFWNWSPRTQGEAAAGVAAVGVLTFLGLRARGARAEADGLRTDLEGRVGRDGRRSGGGRGELREARGRVAELEGNLRAAADGRVEAGNARMAPEVRVQAEARVTELEGKLREAKKHVEDLRSGIRFEGDGMKKARESFRAADSDLQTKQAALAEEQAIVRDMETRGLPDNDANLISHRERVTELEGELEVAQEKFNEASRQNIPKADKRGTARDQALEDLSTARAKVRRLEGELAAAQGVVARDNAAGGALNFLNVRPQAAVPPPLPPPAPGP